MKEYEFTVTLRGKGMDPQSAWEDALPCITANPAMPLTARVDVVATCCENCACTDEDEQLIYIPAVEDYRCPSCKHLLEA